jgi:hypothetical protein
MKLIRFIVLRARETCACFCVGWRELYTYVCVGNLTFHKIKHQTVAWLGQGEWCHNTGRQNARNDKMGG